MAITDKEQGVWELDEVYNKINQGGIWSYTDPNGLYTWGRNEYHAGALGLNDTDDRSSPTQLGGSGWSSEVANSTAGFIARKTNGTLWSWGYNGWGGLGQNQPMPTKTSSPTQIGTDTTWALVHRITVDGSTYAVKTDGSLWAWGNNQHGELADNTSVRKSSPVQIPGTWANSSIVGGAGFATARKSDGTLWTWGTSDGRGQLGLNQQTVKYSSPVQIPGTWSAVGQDYYGSFAIKSGKLYGWGNNEGGPGGRLGQGNNTKYSSPVQVGTDTDWSGPVIGYRYGAMAIKTNGKLYGWGAQDNGDRAGCLGQNSLADLTAPTLIGTDTTWHDITIGTAGCAQGLKTDGTLWTWGGYVYGNTGLNLTGSAAQRSSPTQVPGTWNALSKCSVSSQNQGALKGAAPG